MNTLLKAFFLASSIFSSDAASYSISVEARFLQDKTWTLDTTITVEGPGAYRLSAFQNPFVTISGNSNWITLDIPLTSLSEPHTTLIILDNFLSFRLPLDNPATDDPIDFWISATFERLPTDNTFQMINPDGTLNDFDSSTDRHLFSAGYYEIHPDTILAGGAQVNLFRLRAIPEPSAALILMPSLLILLLRFRPGIPHTSDAWGD